MSKAFDSLDQREVLRAATACLGEEPCTYAVRAFQEVSTGATGQLRMPDRRWPSREAPASAVPWAEAVARTQGGRAGVVLADLASASAVPRPRVVADLEHAVRATVLQAGGQWFHLTRGIPQGSIASSLLCSLVLGDVENRHVIPRLRPAGRDDEGGEDGKRMADFLGETSAGSGAGGGGLTSLAQALTSPSKGSARAPGGGAGPGRGVAAPPAATVGARGGSPSHTAQKDRPLSTGVRLIDDVLFISTSEEAVSDALHALVAHLPRAGCGLNLQKTNLNFVCKLGSPDGTRTGPADSILGPREVCFQSASMTRRFVPYCGLLIHSATLEPQADYSRYVGEDLASALTVGPGAHPGRMLRGKLRLYLSHKCHALLLDPLVRTCSSSVLYNPGRMTRLN